MQSDEETEKEVLEVLRSGVIAQGPKVRQLEQLFEEYLKVKHVVAVNNGTTALIAALKILNLEPGSEVVTTPFTFVATLNAIIDAGLVARFADIDESTFNVSDISVKNLLNDKTSAIMPVHLYGQCADMKRIAELANSADVALVEDAAQAHGATHFGQFAGSFGIGCFSLYATKNISTGEGGLISTNDDAIADRLRVYRNQGMRARYQYEMAGNNFRMTDLQAAVGIPQVKRIETIISRRELNAQYLSDGLSDLDQLVTPTIASGNRHVWHQYTIRLRQDLAEHRDTVVEEINRLGVGAGVYYPRLTHEYECYRNHPQVKIDETPTAARISRLVFSIPVHQYLSQQDLDVIIDVIKKAVTRF